MADRCDGTVSAGRIACSGAHRSQNSLCNVTRRAVFQVCGASSSNATYADWIFALPRGSRCPARADWNFRRTVFIVCLCSLDILCVDCDCVDAPPVERTEPGPSIPTLGISCYADDLPCRRHRVDGEPLDGPSGAVIAGARGDSGGYSVFLSLA